MEWANILSELQPSEEVRSMESMEGAESMEDVDLDAIRAAFSACSMEIKSCECSESVDKQKVGYDIICTGCGVIQECRHDPDRQFYDETEERQVPFRLVGSNSYAYQSNMYKSSSSNYSTTQKMNNMNTFQNCVDRYIREGKKQPVPNTILKRASELFHEVQKHEILRSENRMMTLAVCISIAGNKMGKKPTVAEIADFMGLQKKGVSSAKHSLIKLKNENKISFDPNESVASTTITTYFDYLGIKDDNLHRAIMDIIDTMRMKNIASALQIETKVIGAVYSAILRSKVHPSISISEFCAKCKNMRKNKINGILKTMNDYHSHLVDTYRKHDLNHERL